MPEPNTPFLRLIDALAQQDVRDYLSTEAARRQADAAKSTDRVPLPAMDKAA